jgi:hypothetical protein
VTGAGVVFGPFSLFSVATSLAVPDADRSLMNITNDRTRIAVIAIDA